MNRLLISIIVPVYNHAHTLERSVASIIAQTYRPLEVIIVDDGSTDDLDAAVKRIEINIKKENFDFRFFSQLNKGASSARNRGFRESKGEYVIFWDADTIGRPEMLERLKRQLDNHPEAIYAYSQFRFGWKKFKCQEFNAEDLKKNNYIDTTSLIRRAALTIPYEGGGEGVVKHGGPFDESLTRFQDWDLWLTLLEQNKTGTFVPEVLYTKIVHGRKGLSLWLPKFIYQLPWKGGAKREYEEAKEIIVRKHQLV